MSTGPQPAQVTSRPSTSFQLLVRAQRGDREALEQLFERLFPALRRWARGRLPAGARGALDTADLVQEAFANAFRRLPRFEPRRRQALQAYLRQAIRNRIRDEARRVGRRGVPEELAQTPPGGGASPLDQALARESLTRYQEALARLKAGEQELITGRFELGYSYEQLALATDRPSADSARMAVRRALLRLAQEMGPG